MRHLRRQTQVASWSFWGGSEAVVPKSQKERRTQRYANVRTREGKDDEFVHSIIIHGCGVTIIFNNDRNTKNKKNTKNRKRSSDGYT